MPLDTPSDALAPYLQAAVAPLIAAFGGYHIKDEVTEKAMRRLLDRSL